MTGAARRTRLATHQQHAAQRPDDMHERIAICLEAIEQRRQRIEHRTRPWGGGTTGEVPNAGPASFRPRGESSHRAALGAPRA